LLFKFYFQLENRSLFIGNLLRLLKISVQFPYMVYFSWISLLGSSFSDQPNKEHAMRRIQIEEQAKNTYIPLSLSKKINILQVEKRGLFIPQTFTVQYPEYPLPASMRRVYSEFFCNFYSFAMYKSDLSMWSHFSHHLRSLLYLHCGTLSRGVLLSHAPEGKLRLNLAQTFGGVLVPPGALIKGRCHLALGSLVLERIIRATFDQDPVAKLGEVLMHTLGPKCPKVMIVFLNLRDRTRRCRSPTIPTSLTCCAIWMIVVRYLIYASSSSLHSFCFNAYRWETTKIILTNELVK